MNYYTSDTHFGHANCIGFDERPFGTVEEMNAALIRNWNSVVGKDDHVWHLGDFAYKSSENAAVFLKKLNGHKHLIMGNHDAKWMKNVDAAQYFESIEHATYMVDDQNRRIWMCHYPLMDPLRFTWMLYGHIHANKPEQFWSLLRNMDQALNCCSSVNYYTPATFEQLVANNSIWKSQD